MNSEEVEFRPHAERLKPCPVCGEPAHYIDARSGRPTVACNEECFRMQANDPEALIIAWNSTPKTGKKNSEGRWV